MGPEGAPKIPQKFFRERNPPRPIVDNTSDRIKEFLSNKKKFKNPLNKYNEPEMLDFIKVKMAERELSSYK